MTADHERHPGARLTPAPVPGVTAPVPGVPALANGDLAGWSWLVGRGRLPTTKDGAERVVVLLIVGMRIGTLVQMAPSAMLAIEVSPRPALAATTWVVAAVASIVVSAVVIRRGRPLGPLGTVVDLAVAALLLLLGPLTVLLDDRIGTWVGFQSAYALSVLIASCAVRSRAAWLVGVGAIVTAQLLYVYQAINRNSSATVIGNVLTYLVLACLARAAVSYMRRMAHDADEARTQAAELARREEERRAHVAMHNGATVMGLLADPSIDPQVRARLEVQAKAEAQRLRSYLQGVAPVDGGANGDQPAALAHIVTEVAADFAELPIELALDLGADVGLSPANAIAVHDALTSVLLNVRLHAHAQQVVVHLDRDEQCWMLTVHDDGRGFEPSQTQQGVGLREVVVGELERRGIDAAVRSRPGEGTTITLRAPVLARLPTSVTGEAP
ncbi:MAG: ATP-binding protein [Terracoccus sp.]